MSPKFEISFDHAAARLYWTQRGFWTADDVAAFLTKMQSVVAHLGPPPYVFDALCDSRDFPVQSVEISDAMGLISERARIVRRGRTAIVVGSTLNKLQAQRALVGDDLRVFTTIGEAGRWLATPRN